MLFVSATVLTRATGWTVKDSVTGSNLTGESLLLTEGACVHGASGDDPAQRVRSPACPAWAAGPGFSQNCFLAFGLKSWSYHRYESINICNFFSWV